MTKIDKGDISTLAVNAIVNAANLVTHALRGLGSVSQRWGYSSMAIASHGTGIFDIIQGKVAAGNED